MSLRSCAVGRRNLAPEVVIVEWPSAWRARSGSQRIPVRPWGSRQRNSQQPRFLSRNTERNKNAEKRDDHHEAHSNVRRIEYRSEYRSDRHKKTFNGIESSAELVSHYPTAPTERKVSPLLFGHVVEVPPSRLRARFVLTLHPWVSGAAASRKDAFSICDLLLHPRAGEDLRTWEEGPLVRVACPFAPLKRRGSVVEPEEAAKLTARLELCPRQH